MSHDSFVASSRQDKNVPFQVETHDSPQEQTEDVYKGVSSDHSSKYNSRKFQKAKVENALRSDRKLFASGTSERKSDTQEDADNSAPLIFDVRDAYMWDEGDATSEFDLSLDKTNQYIDDDNQMTDIGSSKNNMSLAPEGFWQAESSVSSVGREIGKDGIASVSERHLDDIQLSSTPSLDSCNRKLKVDANGDVDIDDIDIDDERGFASELLKLRYLSEDDQVVAVDEAPKEVLHT